MSRPRHKITAKTIFYIYDMYAKGETSATIAQSLGMPIAGFDKLCRRNPNAIAAKKYGRRRFKTSRELREDFDDVVIGHLSPEMQNIWKKIKQESKTGSGKNPNTIQVMDRRTKQILFLHAWYKLNFNTVKAAKFLGIPYATISSWRTATEFRRLMDSMQDIRKDFIESSLMNLVGDGNPQAVIFAAKTQLKDRGYGDERVVKGSIDHKHAHAHSVMMNIDLTELDLPVDVQMLVMQAIDKRQRQLEEAQPKANLLEHQPSSENYDSEKET